MRDHSIAPDRSFEENACFIVAGLTTCIDHTAHQEVQHSHLVSHQDLSKALQVSWSRTDMVHGAHNLQARYVEATWGLRMR